MTVFSYLIQILRTKCSYCFISSNVLPDGKWRGRNEGTGQSFERCCSYEGSPIKKSDSSPFLCCNNSAYYSTASPPNLTSYIATHGRPPPLTRVPSMSDVDLTMPEMNMRSFILSQYQVSALYLTLSPRLRLYPWTMLYSITRDGCSLKNLYKRLENYDQALLFLILDTRKTAFGAVLSSPNLKLQGKVYTGTPETFLFSFYPKLRKFHASGENNYFVQAMTDGISIGGWRPALWVDCNLEKGTTDVSPTFDNSPLTDENFVIKELECWALAEPEHTAGLKPSRSSNAMYQSFASSLLASKKPEVEIGGVRCGRKSRNYYPTYVRESSIDKSMFTLGEEDEGEEESWGDKSNVFETPRKRESVSTSNVMASCSSKWSSLYV